MSQPVQNTNHHVTRFAVSVSRALNDRAMGYLAIGKEDGNIKAVAKYTAKEVVSAANFAFGSVEAVIRNVLLVVAKTVHFFVPKGYSQTFDDKILNPLLRHAYVNSVNALDAGTKLVTNLLNNKRQSAVKNTILDGMGNVYFSNFVDALARLHVNGFAAGFTAPTLTTKQMINLKEDATPERIREAMDVVGKNNALRVEDRAAIQIAKTRVRTKENYKALSKVIKKFNGDVEQHKKDVRAISNAIKKYNRKTAQEGYFAQGVRMLNNGWDYIRNRAQAS